MTIDEAISHAREVAECQKMSARLIEDNAYIPESVDKEAITYGNTICANEHEQLAEWLEELKQYRQWMLEPLKVLRQAFKEENATISSVTTVLRQVLESMKLEEKLESFSNYFLERKEPGDENRAREYSQVYERVMELLERLEGLLGDEKAELYPDPGCRF